MHIQRVEEFIAVVDAGSIRGAARLLGASQPALTRSMQQLEHELGVQLMQRTVRGASLTPAGSAFLARARVATAELRLGADEARRGVDRGGELVSLGVSPSAASLLLPEFATSLQRQRPQTRIRLLELTPSALLPLLREAALDMAVTYHSRSVLDAGLRYRSLFEIQMRVAVRNGHPMSGARTLGELAAASWLSMAAPGSPGDIIRQSFLADGLTPPVPAVHCSSHSVAIDLIAASDKVGLLPPALLRSHIAAGSLAELHITKPLVPLHVGLYSRADTPSTPATKAATNIIVGIARRLTASGELRSTAPARTTTALVRRRTLAR